MKEIEKRMQNIESMLNNSIIYFDNPLSLSKFTHTYKSTNEEVSYIAFVGQLFDKIGEEFQTFEEAINYLWENYPYRFNPDIEYSYMFDDIGTLYEED